MGNKIKQVVKETKTLGTLIIKEIPYETAKDMIINNHYSGKWNTSFGKYNFGIFKDKRLLGCAVYGNLMIPKSYEKWSDFVDEGGVIELNRMWIDDELGHNAETVLISASIKLLRNNYEEVKIVQTFADGRLGCGTIYKASNFNYYGYEETLFYEHIDDKSVHHCVPFTNSKRPQGMIKLNGMFFEGKLRAFKVKTYRYGFIIDRRLRKKIKYKQLPYPTYEKGKRYIDDYIHPSGITARCFLYFDAVKDSEHRDLAKQYFLENNLGDWETELEHQRQNESYQWFMEDYDKSEMILNNLQTNIFDFL